MKRSAGCSYNFIDIFTRKSDNSDTYHSSSVA